MTKKRKAQPSTRNRESIPSAGLAREKTPSSKESQSFTLAQWFPGGWVGIVSIAVVVVLSGIIYLTVRENDQTVQTLISDMIVQTSAAQQPETKESTANTSSSNLEEEPHALPPTGSQPGYTASDFALVSLSGEEIALSSFRGQPVFVSFFHTW